jgi:hypothetical protein
MNKVTLITLGIVLILLMGGLWGYLFLYGAPEKPKEVFSNLGIIGNTSKDRVRTIGEAQVPQNAQLLSLGGTTLEQITTRLVAGFGTTNREGIVRYVEQGTGHIFEVDITSGLERQISRTTIAETVDALFSRDGTSVALITHEGSVKNTHVGRITDSGELSSVRKLPQNANDVLFEGETLLYYTTESSIGTQVRTLDFGNLEEATIATIPLSDIRVSSYNPLIFAPKPSRGLFGALYSMKGASLSPLSPLYEELVGFTLSGTPLFTYTENDLALSGAVLENTVVAQSVPLIPEKCTSYRDNQLWCAAPATISPTFVTDWYKGTRSFDDYLWLVDLKSAEAGLVANLSELARKRIDVDDIALDTDQKRLFLINKIDGYLWMYTL